MLPSNPLKKTCLALAIAHTLAIPAAQAATIIVNTTGDTDGNDQACTLREAILSIHDSSPASKGCTFTGLFGVNDTVGFVPGLNNQVIRLEQASPLSITKNLTINGLGEDRLTIDRIAPAPPIRNSRIFSVDTASVQINNLKITGGITHVGGAGIYGIDSNLILSNITVSGNTTFSTGADYEYGGGIGARRSSVSLINSTVSNNSAGLGGGGISARTSSVLSIVNSTVSGNSASYTWNGGGILVEFGSKVTLTDSTVSGNSAGGNGGGIYARGLTTGANSVSLTNSTVSGNSADGNGGGIFASGSSKISLFKSTVSGNSAMELGGGITSVESRVHLYDSTVSGNSAKKSGGGILFGGNDSGDFLTLWHSTVTNNTAGDDGGGIGAIGSVVVRFTNSIISGNMATDLGDEIGTFGGTFIVDRNNLFGDSSKSNAQAFDGFNPDPSDSDITATSDGTMPTALTSILQTTLKYNGGQTKTHALVVGSPAIDAGLLSWCSANDQRGEERNDGKCDIGSYEFIDSSCYVINTPADKIAVFCL